jgi:nitroimidazol reductase NimA-like FMN-containing flavoprotein (pyridoxamine 5'-phosphate oxidase superfamily)
VTVRRHAGRGSYERAVVDGILDEGLVAHVGIVAEDQPYVIPVLYARDGESIFIHGSPLSRLLHRLGEAVPMCLTVTLLDGVVFARSAFHHSLNYRSVVVLGEGRLMDPEEKHAALRTVVEHVASGRADDVRGPSEKELAATEVVAITIREASAKIRTGPPLDSAKDMAIPAWAGVLPLSIAPGEPIPDDGCDQPLPTYITDYARA